MKNILLLLAATTTIFNTKAFNSEYQKMLATRATILELKKPTEKQDSLSFPALIKEEETLNTQFTDLLEQLKNLTDSNYDQANSKINHRNRPTS